MCAGPCRIGRKRRRHGIGWIDAHVIVQLYWHGDFGSGFFQYNRVIQIKAITVAAFGLKKVGRRGNRGVACAANGHDFFHRVRQ